MNQTREEKEEIELNCVKIHKIIKKPRPITFQEKEGLMMMFKRHLFEIK